MHYQRLAAVLAAVAFCLNCCEPLRANSQRRPRAGMRQERGGDVSRGSPAPKAAEAAPMFKLKTLDGKGEVDLKSFAGKRPVLLFFGSYT